MKLSFRKLSYVKKRTVARFTGRMNVHYLHIRKTGGTAIKSALSTHIYTPNAVLHLHPHRIRLSDIPRGDKLFFAVRDPVSRYVSGFMSRLNQSRPATFVPWSEKETEAFETFSDPESLALALDPSHPLHQQARCAMVSISHLNSMQWDWLGGPEIFHARADQILWPAFQETLNDDFLILKELLQLPESVEMPKGQSAANRFGQPKPNLSPDAVNLVKDWYRADYELIEICESLRAENAPKRPSRGHL